MTIATPATPGTPGTSDRVAPRAGSSTTSAAAAAAPRRLGRSIAAVLIAFIAVAVLSLATDQILHMLEIYPPWGAPMYEPGLNLLALSYRVLYAIAGGYIVSALAPRAPMRHVWVLGIIGFVAATAGAVAAISIGGLGPHWYPILLAVTALPTTWLGGVLHGGARAA